MSTVDLVELEGILAGHNNDQKLKSITKLAEELENPDYDFTEQTDQLVSVLKSALKSPNVHIAQMALSCLPVFFNRLISTDQGSTNHKSLVLRNAISQLAPFHQLVDSKEKVRDLACKTLVEVGRSCLLLGKDALLPKERESIWTWFSKSMQEHAFTSKNAKAREQSLHYLSAMRSSEHAPLPPLRPFTTFLLALLSDSDPSVRALALSTTISIFTAESVTDAARADLKKALPGSGVTKKIEDAILYAVLGRGGAITPGLEAANDPKPEMSKTTRKPLEDDPFLSHTLPANAFPPTDLASGASDVHPVYIASEKDLLHEFEAMKPCFAGKEDEHNWSQREKSIARIRGLIKGEAHTRFPETLLAGIKLVLDGIIKTTSSLRTILATSSLSLVSEIAEVLGPHLDSMFEPLFFHILGMAAQTKKIVANASQDTVKVLITNTHYHIKVLQHLSAAMCEKNPSGRAFVSKHVITLLEVHGDHLKHLIDNGTGLEYLDTIFKKGLSDASPPARTNTRAAFWKVKALCPSFAARILEKLDPSTRKQVEKSEPNQSNDTESKRVVSTVRSHIAQVKAANMRNRSIPISHAHTSSIPRLTSPTRNYTSPPRSTTPIGRPSPRSARISTTPSTSPTLRAAQQTPKLNNRSSVSSTSTLSQSPPPPKFVPASPSPSTPMSSSLMDTTSPFEANDNNDDKMEVDEVHDEVNEVELQPKPQPQPQLQPPVISMYPKPAFGDTPAPKRMISLTASFKDSPDLKEGISTKGANNWWANKTRNVEKVPATDSDANDFSDLLTSLNSGKITPESLERLSRISRAYPVPTGCTPETYEPAKFWESNRRFEKLFTNLTKFFKIPLDEDQTQAAFVLLRDLVENQHPCFSGSEIDFYTLVFQLREDPSRTAVAAVEAITELFSDKLQPLSVVRLVRTTLESHLDTTEAESSIQAHCHALGLKLFSKYIRLLDSTQVVDVLPRLSLLIRTGLNSTSGFVRRAAVNSLVSAERVLGNEDHVYSLVEDLAIDQITLISYYIEREKAKG